MKNKLLFLILLVSSHVLFAQDTLVGDYKTTSSGSWADPFEIGEGVVWAKCTAIGDPASWSTVDMLDSPNPLENKAFILHDVAISWADLTISANGKIIIAPTGSLHTYEQDIINTVEGVNGIIIRADETGTGVGQFMNKSNIAVTQEIYLSGSAWHLIGSPFDQTNTAVTFFGSYLQQYNENDNSWTWNDEAGFDFTMNRGYGYSHWNTSSAIYTMSGTLTASDVVLGADPDFLPWSPDRIVPPEIYGYTLFSNPYSCTINFNATWLMDGMTDAVWIYNGTNYISTPSATPGKDIPVGTGFFMQTNNPDPDYLPGITLTIPADSRILDVHDNPFKATSEDLPKYARLKIENPINNYFDEIHVRFIETASLNYNFKTDAPKMYGSEESPQLFVLTAEDKAVSIKGLDANQNSTLRMQLRPNVDATYRITAKEFTFDPTTVVLLEDLFTTDEPMIVDASLDYTFSSLATDDESRFVIYVRPAVTGIDTPDAETQFTVFGSNDFVRILSNESNYKLSVYNLLGQMLVEKNNLNGNASIDLSAFKQTIVLVSIQTEKEIISKKIQLK